MRVTLKKVNDKLADLDTKAETVKGAGYLFFRGDDVEGWIDRTVRVPAISSLTPAFLLRFTDPLPGGSR